MRKILFLILVIAFLFVVGCQKSGTSVVENKVPAEKTTATTATTTDATVDSVGNDINNVDSVDKDLSSDDLSGLDSGLNDVQTI